MSGDDEPERPRKRSLRRSLLATALVVLVPLALLAAVGWFWGRPNRAQLLGGAVDPDVLRRVPWVVGGVLLVWWVGLWFAHRATHPRDDPRRRQWVSHGVALLGGLAVAGPLVTAGYYSTIQRDLVTTVARDELSATRPDLAGGDWGGRERVTVLLLGGDAGVGRTGIRTDSMILLSIDTDSGRTTSFSLPRNLLNPVFPAKTRLARAYPDGFVGSGGDPGNSMLNAVYRIVPIEHHEAIGRSDNPGADALKLAVSGSLGVPVDYYVLVNLNGFKQIVEAIGGITVNINQPIPIQGDTDRGIPPTGYLKPGPNRRLDGFHALWYARGRWGLSDYDRMERQRCALAAILDEAKPTKLLLRYTRLAKASKKILRTDIPQRMLPDFAALAVEMKDRRMTSVVFQRSDKFDPNAPDFGYMRKLVRTALAAKRPASKPSSKATASATADPTAQPADNAPDDSRDACSYQPVKQD